MTEKPYSPERPLPSERLVEAGEALFGRQWQSELARALSEGNFNPSGKPILDAYVRKWLRGERSIPDWVWPAIQHVMRVRSGRMMLLADQITETDAEWRAREIREHYARVRADYDYRDVWRDKGEQ